jgi:hypothetical protein
MYLHGDMSAAYPLTRALPMIFEALINALGDWQTTKFESYLLKERLNTTQVEWQK